MRFRQPGESDHGPVVGWWVGRRVADKPPRLFFRYFRETSFAVEENGEIVGSPADEAYIHFVGVRPESKGGGVEDGVSVHTDCDGYGKDRIVFVREVC